VVSGPVDLAASVPAGTFQSALVARIGQASDRVTVAESAAASNAKKAKKLLAKAAATVKKTRAKIGSKKGKKTITDATVRTTLQTEADSVRSAILALRGTL